MNFSNRKKITVTLIILLFLFTATAAEIIVLQNGVNGYTKTTDFLLWHFTATDASPDGTMNFNRKTLEKEYNSLPSGPTLLSGSVSC